jgi:hypothetical protein
MEQQDLDNKPSSYKIFPRSTTSQIQNLDSIFIKIKEKNTIHKKKNGEGLG